MAQVFPPEIQREALSEQVNLELDTLVRLQQELPDDYVVFHSVHWSMESARYNQFGEVDFVVINRAGRCGSWVRSFEYVHRVF